MDIDVFPSRDLDTVFRVLRTALNAKDALEPRERRFLDTYARITGHALGRADPLPVIPQHVQIEGAHRRKRLVQLAAIAALLSHPVREGSAAFLQKLSRHLAVRDGAVDVIDALARGQREKARFLAMRRAFGALVKEARAAEGLMGVVRFFGALLLKTSVNKDRLWNYKRLGLLPEGTLGREYWKHLTETGFGFPGEPGGIAETVAYHDIAHVLAGHDTTPLGEIQQGAFQGGNRREDGFFFIQFAILQFHHGVRITPVAEPRYGSFHPEKVLWAIHRGAQCTVDMTHQWDFWPLMPLPLAEARARCGLLPKLQANALRWAA
jgi:hypothetical protein